MPTQLEIRPETADKLTDLAKSRGVSVDELLFEMVAEMNSSSSRLDLPIEEFERDLDALSEGLEELKLEYTGTYPRSDIYLDHD